MSTHLQNFDDGSNPSEFMNPRCMFSFYQSQTWKKTLSIQYFSSFFSCKFYFLLFFIVYQFFFLCNSILFLRTVNHQERKFKQNFGNFDVWQIIVLFLFLFSLSIDVTSALTQLKDFKTETSHDSFFDNFSSLSLQVEIKSEP